MRQSLKAILQLIVLVAAIVCLCAWFIPRHADQTVWACRLGGMAIAGSLGWVLYKNATQKEILPDLLRQITPNCFEILWRPDLPTGGFPITPVGRPNSIQAKAE